MGNSDDLDLDALADALAARLAKRLHVNGERLIDLPELAQRIGVSERGARGLAARGELPAGVLIGGLRRWSWSAVEKFLASREGRQRRRGRGRQRRAD
jgi:predicted DNA-binding transcriptional regulator AlpA